MQRRTIAGMARRNKHRCESAGGDAVDQLQEWMDANDWTITDLAEELGRSVSLAWGIMRRKRLPTLPTALTIERAFGIPPREWADVRGEDGQPLIDLCR